MAFCIQYKPNPFHHYVLTGFVGFDESLYWFTSDLHDILGDFHHSNARVRHVAGTLKDALLPSLLPQNLSKKHVTSHEAASRLLQTSPVEAIQEFARILDSPETYVRVLAEYDPANFQNPTQLIILNEVTVTDMLNHDLFFVWFTFFKKKAIRTLYKTLDDRTTEEEMISQQQPEQQPQPEPQPEQQPQQEQQQDLVALTPVINTAIMGYARILKYDAEGYPNSLVLMWKGSLQKFYSNR